MGYTLQRHETCSTSSRTDSRALLPLIFVCRKMLGLQLQAEMQRFPDQASSLTMHTGFEEFFRRSKATYVAPAASIRSCSEPCIDSSSSSVRNHRGLFVPRHGPRLVQLHRSEQSNFRLAELDFRILDLDYRYSGRNVDRHRIFASRDGSKPICMLFHPRIDGWVPLGNAVESQQFRSH